eukprot:scaffold115231_cov38-Tisochrysis_lutea.AAC.4
MGQSRSRSHTQGEKGRSFCYLCGGCDCEKQRAFSVFLASYFFLPIFRCHFLQPRSCHVIATQSTHFLASPSHLGPSRYIGSWADLEVGALPIGAGPLEGAAPPWR